MKPVSFATLKKIQKMSLNDFNRWTSILYQSGFEDGVNKVQEATVAEMNEVDLYNMLLLIRGIGPVRALRIMQKLVRDDWKIEDFCEDE